MQMKNESKKVALAALLLLTVSTRNSSAQTIFPSVQGMSFDIQNAFATGVPFEQGESRSDFERMREVWQLFLGDHLFIEKVEPVEVSEIATLVAEQLVAQYKTEISGIRLRFERTLDPHGLVRLPDTFWKELEVSAQASEELSFFIGEAFRLGIKESLSPEELVRGQTLLTEIPGILFGSLRELRNDLSTFLLSPLRREALLDTDNLFSNERENILLQTYKVVLLQAGGVASAQSLLAENLLGFFDNDIGKQVSSKKLALKILSEGVAYLDSHGSVEERSEVAWSLAPPKAPTVFVPLGPRVLTTRMQKKFEYAFESDSLVTRALGGAEVGLDVLKFHRFSCAEAECYQELETQLNAAQHNPNTRGMLIDLRDNPGGYVELLNRSLDMFLDKEGELLYTTWDRKGQKVQDVFDTEKYIYKKPVVILINRNSASAAEFFTAVLKAQGRALVLGEDRSFGKAVVMTPGKLRSGSQATNTSHWNQMASVTRSVALATFPDGTSHQVVGVRPHIEFPGYYQLTRTGEGFLRRRPEALPPADEKQTASAPASTKVDLKRSLATHALVYEELIRKHSEALARSFVKMGSVLQSAESPAMGEIRKEWSTLAIESLEMQYRLAAEYVSSQ